MVYLGGALSLAALETFVHLSAADTHLELVAIEAVIPEDVRISQLPRGRLPANWRTEPPPAETKAIGSGWARTGETLLLRVPSVIVPRESNYLLNPVHKDFPRVKIRAPEAFGFDRRMWK